MMIPSIKIAVHPWEILRDYIDGLGVSQRKFAGFIWKKPAEINYVINGIRGINTDMAIRLSVAFWTRPEFWLGMQYDYDVYRLSQSEKQNDYKEIESRMSQYALA